MEKEFKAKYESYKLTVKQWEHKFTKENHRIPSKVSLISVNFEFLFLLFLFGFYLVFINFFQDFTHNFCAIIL